MNEKTNLLEVLEIEEKKVKKKMDDFVTLRLEGDMSKEIFPIHYKPLKERCLQIQAQLTEIEAEIDFLKIQTISNETIQEDAKTLYDQWEKLPFEEMRTIVETITGRIIIDKEDISLKLSYIPILPIVIVGKSQCIRRGSMGLRT